jgi:hypothetical protein
MHGEPNGLRCYRSSGNSKCNPFRLRQQRLEDHSRDQAKPDGRDNRIASCTSLPRQMLTIKKKGNTEVVGVSEVFHDFAFDVEVALSV